MTKSKTQIKSEDKTVHEFLGMVHNCPNNSWNHVANVQHAMNKKQPIKTYTKAEIEEYKKAHGL